MALIKCHIIFLVPVRVGKQTYSFSHFYENFVCIFKKSARGIFFTSSVELFFLYYKLIFFSRQITVRKNRELKFNRFKTSNMYLWKCYNRRRFKTPQVWKGGVLRQHTVWCRAARYIIIYFIIITNHCLKKNINGLLKGTVQRDFWPAVFS